MRRRTIRDWTPDLGNGQEWLAQLESEGWVPEHGSGVRVTVNGQDVVRYAFIEIVPTAEEHEPATGD